jgi:hypothetical protein
MPDDLPRIGPEPDCEYPGCLLLGRTRVSGWHRHHIVCSLHTDWNGEAPPMHPLPEPCGEATERLAGVETGPSANRDDEARRSAVSGSSCAVNNKGDS